MSRPTRSRSPHLDIPHHRKSLEDPGAKDLSSDDEHFSDASEGKELSRPVTPSSPIPRTRVERVDDAPAHGEVPGTPAYDQRTKDAVPDEMEVVPEGSLSKRASQNFDRPTTPGGSFAPRTVVEKVDPSATSYGDDPGSRAFQHRKTDSVPDLVLKAPGDSRRREADEMSPTSSAATMQIPETIITRVDSRPAHGEVEGTEAYEKRRQDAEPDVLEQKDDVRGSPTLDRSLKGHRRKSTLQSNLHENNDNDFGDDFDDFEEGEEANVDDDFGEFDEGFQETDDTTQQRIPEPPQENIQPLVDFDALSSLPELPAATQQHLDMMFPSTTNENLTSVPQPVPVSDTSPIFPSERSRSLWKQLVTPPPLQPPNWTQSRIRRLFLVSLGVPVNLNEILPPSKQKKLVLPNIDLEPSPRKSESDKTLGSIARLKAQAANDSTGSLDSTQSATKDSKANRGRKPKGPPPPPDLDLTAVKRLCATTDEKLDGFTDEEIQAHVKQLELLTERTSEVLEYWLKRRDGLRKEKEAFEGVIENLVAHVRRVRR